MKTRFVSLIAGLALLGPAPALAQHDHAGRQHGAGAPAQQGPGPYAGLQTRAIKALSEQQLSDLRAGKGMSLALPAELNGYPGPSHALELSAQLGLSAEQRARTQRLFAKMQQEARAAGEEVIAAEAALDGLFRDRKATPETLRTATAEAARAQGLLRETHLRYHLAMVELLSAEQVAAYGRLRGY